MNIRIKMKRILTLLLSLIFFAGCGDDDEEGGANTSGDFDGTWKVTFIGDYAKADCTGDIDSTGWAFSSILGFSATLEIDGGSATFTTIMGGTVVDASESTFSEVDGAPCLDGECLPINWISSGSVWSVGAAADAYCEDADGNDTSDADEIACEGNGNDWYASSCSHSVYTKQ